MAETMLFNMLMPRAAVSGESKAVAGGVAGDGKGAFLSQNWAKMLSSAMQTVEKGAGGEGEQIVGPTGKAMDSVISGNGGGRRCCSDVSLSGRQEADAALQAPFITGGYAKDVPGFVQVAAVFGVSRSASPLSDQGEANDKMETGQANSKSTKDRLREGVFLAAIPNTLVQQAGMEQSVKTESDSQESADGPGLSIGLLEGRPDGDSELFQELAGNVGRGTDIGLKRAGESSGGLKPAGGAATQNDELFWKMADGSQQGQHASGIVVSPEDNGQTQDGLQSIANSSPARPSPISSTDFSNARNAQYREDSVSQRGTPRFEIQVEPAVSDQSTGASGQNPSPNDHYVSDVSMPINTGWQTNDSVSRLMTGAMAQAERQPAGVQGTGNLKNSLVRETGEGKVEGGQGLAQTPAESLKTILLRMGDPSLMRKPGVQQQGLGIDADSRKDSTGQDVTVVTQKDVNNRSGSETSSDQRDRTSAVIYAAGVKSDVEPPVVSDHAAAGPTISLQGNEMQGKDATSGFILQSDSQTPQMQDVPQPNSSKKETFFDKYDMGIHFSPTELTIHSHGTAQRPSIALSAGGLGDVVEKAVLTAKGTPTEIQVRLQPENLGSLNMRIGVESGQLQVHITTDNATTKDLLNHQVHLLRADLENKGLFIDKIQVEVSDARADSNAWGGGGQSSHQQRNENDGTTFASQQAEALGLSVEAPRMESQPEMPTERRLSAFA